MARYQAIGLVANRSAFPKVASFEFDESGLPEEEQKAIKLKLKDKSLTAARNLLGRAGWHIVGIVEDDHTKSTHYMLERQIDT